MSEWLFLSLSDVLTTDRLPPFIRSFSFVRSFVCSFVRLFVCSFVRSFVRLFVRCCCHPFVVVVVRRSLIVDRSFVRSFVPSRSALSDFTVRLSVGRSLGFAWRVLCPSSVVVLVVVVVVAVAVVCFHSVHACSADAVTTFFRLRWCAFVAT